MTNFSFYEVPALQAVIDDQSINSYDTIEATLYSVRNFSDHMWICNDALQTMSFYWAEHFKAFDSGGHFFLSMLQNFLGSVISLTNIYFSMEENVKTGNNIGVQYDTARIFRILIFFEPVELKDDDFSFDDGSAPDVADIDNIPDPDVNEEQEAIDQLLEEEREDAAKDDLVVEGAAINEQGTIETFFSKAVSALTLGHQAKRQFNSQINPAPKLQQTPLTQQSWLDANDDNLQHPRVGAGIFSHLDDKERGSTSELDSWLGVWDVIRGFMNATQLTFGNNRTEC